MWLQELILLRSANFKTHLPLIRLAHFQITSKGEKVVVSKQHYIKSKREKWQKVKPMGEEPEIRNIKRIEKDERLHSDPMMAKVTASSKLNQLQGRLKVSGFCRETKPYDPPYDVNEKINRICLNVFGKTDSDSFLSDPALKFKFLVQCHQEFDHEIPNSDLFRMTSIGEVRNFYQTPVRGRSNYEQLVQNSPNLPQNLHVIAEPIRFNSQTDEFFDGISAFPGNRQELVGLRAKKKYPTYNDNFVWPDV